MLYIPEKPTTFAFTPDPWLLDIESTLYAHIETVWQDYIMIAGTA